MAGNSLERSRVETRRKGLTKVRELTRRDPAGLMGRPFLVETTTLVAASRGIPCFDFSFHPNQACTEKFGKHSTDNKRRNTLVGMKRQWRIPYQPRRKGREPALAEECVQKRKAASFRRYQARKRLVVLSKCTTHSASVLGAPGRVADGDNVLATAVSSNSNVQAQGLLGFIAPTWVKLS